MPSIAQSNSNPGASRKRPQDAPLGCLYLVATPIGNLEDLTLRALRILKEVDLIACEDTRQTRKLLAHYDIHTRTESYHEHNELTRAPELVIELEQGARIALVSDAGTPLVSDPGHHLVALCLRHTIPVVPIPGPSALIAALAAAGLVLDQFVFVGFLPSRSGERSRTLRGLAGETRALVFYEAPHRLIEMLEDCRAVLGNRAAVVARELTKVHEEFRRGRIEDLLADFRKKSPRGEFTVIVGPADELAQTGSSVENASVPLSRRVEEIMQAERLDHKAALKQAARERGLTKRDAYKQLLATRGA